MDLKHIDIDGPIHYVDLPGPDADSPVAVLVHGLGASQLSWHPLLPHLTATHRVVAPDLVGFGHSAPEERGSTVRDNRDHLVRFLRGVVDGPVTLVGNSMGGMISILAAHAHPRLVDGLVLVNPALPGVLNPKALRGIDPQVALHFALYLTPMLGEGFMRLRRTRSTPAQQVRQLLELVCVDPDRVPRDTVSLLVSLAATRRGYAWSDASFLAAQRSVMHQLTIGRSRYLEAIDGLRMPVLLLHGEEDRLVDVSAARAVAPRNPRIELVTLPDVGHAPQLEAPEQVAEHLNRWLESTAAERTGRQQSA